MNGSPCGEPSIGSMTSRRIRRMAYCVCVVLAFAAAAAEGATKRTVKSELTRLAARARSPRRPRPAARVLQRHQARGQAAAARHDPPQRAHRRHRHRRGDRPPAAADRPAARPAVADARAQPLLLDDPHHRAEHAPDLVPGLRADLAVLPGPGPAVPPARQLRASSTSSGTSATTRWARCSTSCSRCAVPRAGGIAWEYYFAFGGGRPPWVSGLAQGTGIQSIARAAKRTGREDEVLPDRPSRRSACSRPRRPRACASRRADGAEYALYSFAPNLHVINGFVQALVGLYDLGKIAGDADAQALYVEGERVARRELPTFDTGAWSLYSRGSSRARVRPLLPPAAALVPAPHVHPHRRSRLLRHRAALRPVRARAAASSRSRRRGCAAARSARCACGCRRSRASGCSSARGGRLVSTRLGGRGRPRRRRR